MRPYAHRGLPVVGHHSRPGRGQPVPAGGAHPTHAYWLQGCARHVGGGKIDLPANWRALIDEGEVDLGPIEASRRVSS